MPVYLCFSQLWLTMVSEIETGTLRPQANQHCALNSLAVSLGPCHIFLSSFLHLCLCCTPSLSFCVSVRLIPWRFVSLSITNLTLHSNLRPLNFWLYKVIWYQFKCFPSDHVIYKSIGARKVGDSGVEHLPRICGDLGLIPESTQEQEIKWTQPHGDSTVRCRSRWPPLFHSFIECLTKDSEGRETASPVECTFYYALRPWVWVPGTARKCHAWQTLRGWMALWSVSFCV